LKLNSKTNSGQHAIGMMKKFMWKNIRYEWIPFIESGIQNFQKPPVMAAVGKAGKVQRLLWEAAGGVPGKTDSVTAANTAANAKGGHPSSEVVPKTNNVNNKNVEGTHTQNQPSGGSGVSPSKSSTGGSPSPNSKKSLAIQNSVEKQKKLLDPPNFDPNFKAGTPFLDMGIVEVGTEKSFQLEHTNLSFHSMRFDFSLTPGVPKFVEVKYTLGPKGVMAGGKLVAVLRCCPDVEAEGWG
jgi:hypothetical protein